MQQRSSYTFVGTLVPVGGGGGGGRSLAVDRPALERTIGSVFLDRLNGFPVGSIAQIFQDNGGQNSAVIEVLEKAFGDNFDAVADQGRDYALNAVAQALKDVLAAEGLVAPTTPGFRDILLHLDTAINLRSSRIRSSSPSPSSSSTP